MSATCIANVILVVKYTKSLLILNIELGKLFFVLDIEYCFTSSSRMLALTVFQVTRDNRTRTVY